MRTRPPARISTFAPVLHLEVLSVLRSGLLASGALLILPAGLYLWLAALSSTDTAPGRGLAGILMVTGTPLALVAGLMIGGTDWVPGLRTAVEFHRLAMRTDASVLRALLLARVVVWTAWFLQCLPLLFLVTALGGVSPDFLASAGLLQYTVGLLGVFLRWILTLLFAGGVVPVRITLGVVLAGAIGGLLMEHLRQLGGALDLATGPLDSGHVQRMLLGVGVFGALALFGWSTLDPAQALGTPRILARRVARRAERPAPETFLILKDRRWPRAASWGLFLALVGIGLILRPQPALVLGLVFLAMLLEGVRAAREGFHREREEETWDALRLLPTPPGAFVLQKLEFFHEMLWLWFGVGAVLLPAGLEWEDHWMWVASLRAFPQVCLLYLGRCWVRNWSYRLMHRALSGASSFPRLLACALPTLALPGLLVFGNTFGLFENALGLLVCLVLVYPDVFTRVSGINGNPALSRLIHAVEEPPAEPGTKPARWMD